VSLDKANFLVIAKGSIGEFKTQVDIGIEIGYINPDTGRRWMQESDEISKVLNSLIFKFKYKQKNNTKQ
jgi:four helix bundle protein